MGVETSRAEAPEPPSRPTRSAEARRSDPDASIDDERPLPRKDDYKGSAETIERTLNGPRPEAEEFYNQGWTGSFDSTNPHPTRREAAIRGTTGKPMPMLGRKPDRRLFVKSEQVEPAVLKTTAEGSRDTLSAEQQWRMDRLVHMRPGVQSRYADADGPSSIARADKEVANAQKSLEDARASGDQAGVRKGEHKLRQAEDMRAEAPVQAAEATLDAARDAQVGSVTTRRYAAESDPWMADADPQHIREAGEDAALVRKYEAEAHVKQAELDVAKAKFEHVVRKTEGLDAAAAHAARADTEALVAQAEADLSETRKAETDFENRYAAATEHANQGEARRDDTAAEVGRTEQLVNDARAKRTEAERNLADAEPSARAEAEEALREAEAALVVARKQEWRAQDEHYRVENDLPARAERSARPEDPERPEPIASKTIRNEHGIMRTDIGKLIGELAVEHRIADINRDPSRSGRPFSRIEELPDRGAGHLDMPFEADHEVYGKEYLIYEAKGPSAKRGSAGGYEQGHPVYLDNALNGLYATADENRKLIAEAERILDPATRDEALGNLRAHFKADDLDTLKKEFTAERDKAAELIEARRLDVADKESGQLGQRVRYLQVQAVVEPSDRGLKSQYKGHKESEFDLDR